MHGYFSTIHNCRFIAKSILEDIKLGRVSKEQGKEALFRLLLTACGAKEKE